MTPIDKIRNELTNDPLAVGYSAMATDQDVVDSLNAATISQPHERRHTARKVLKVLGETDGTTVLDLVETMVATSRSFKVANDALNSYGEGGGIEFGSDMVRAMIGGLVQANAITAAIGTKLESIGEDKVSRASQLGLGVVKPGHVQEARR